MGRVKSVAAALVHAVAALVDGEVLRARRQG